MKKIICFGFFALFMILSGCASIEGTRNKSYTINQFSPNQKIGSLAILPIKENAMMPGLSNHVENSLYKALILRIRGVKIIDAQAFGSLLAKNDLISDFGQWRAGYEALPPPIKNGPTLAT